ncbi:MAG: alpha/beta hydrolase [Woeseiaceae bacterium]|nr:alpha/beta hydrolase [Woeseiaceae bacterium]
MPKPPKTERLFLDGPAGRLEAILEMPDDVPLSGLAVVLHPHPQHGGTMHNKVAHTLSRAFVRRNHAALRFNFRGTEASEGEYDAGNGELEDALAAIDWLMERQPGLPLWLGGFSFGAAIAIRAAISARVDGLVTIAPAVSRFANGLDTQPDCPWLVVQGDEDELVEVDETIDWVNGLEPGPELLVFEGAEHFFHGRLVELRDAIDDFVARHAA